MSITKIKTPFAIVSSDESKMSHADLPPIGTTRWVASRKAAVVEGIISGLISVEDAIKAYDLSVEELTGWMQNRKNHGTAGLKITNLQTNKQLKRE